MSKSKEELNAIKEEVETVSKKLHELTEEELKQVTGSSSGFVPVDYSRLGLGLPGAEGGQR